MSQSVQPSDAAATDDTNTDEQPRELDKIKRFIEILYKQKISAEFDRIIPIVADEGMGKSTFMCQFTWLWQQQVGRTPTPDSVLDRIVWGSKGEFKDAMSQYPPESCIPVQDGARVLHKKEAMHGDQIELEKDLLDVRMKAFVIPVGFQDWEVVPDLLQRRRAKNVFRIPRRGVIEGYNRSSIDEKRSTGEWPDPDLRDRFPSLEGTTLWKEFKRRDQQRKESRIDEDPDSGENNDSPEEMEPRAVVDEILSGNNLETYLSDNNGQTILDADLIRYHYPELTKGDAKVVKKGLLQESDIDAI